MLCCCVEVPLHVVMVEEGSWVGGLCEMASGWEVSACQLCPKDTVNRRFQGRMEAISCH
jgi:hypothetical protein